MYDEFGQIPKTPDAIEVITSCFPQAGKTVVDVGSGTGLSPFKLARQARFVIGVEIEPSKRALAVQSAGPRDVGNLRFDPGDAEHLPLEDRSVDAANRRDAG